MGANSTAQSKVDRGDKVRGDPVCVVPAKASAALPGTGVSRLAGYPIATVYEKPVYEKPVYEKPVYEKNERAMKRTNVPRLTGRTWT
jgi:hypothetical protein